MPSTKNATNRIRKSRREGIPAATGNSGPNRRGVARMKSSGGDADLPANPSRSASALVSKRKTKRDPERAQRRGERTEPRQAAARRKAGPAAGKAVKRRGRTSG